MEIKSPLEGKLGPCCRSTGCCRGGWRTRNRQQGEPRKVQELGVGGEGLLGLSGVLRLIVEGSPVAAKA